MCRTRVVINMQGLPLTGAFDEASQTLTISRAEQHQHAQPQEVVVQDQNQALPPQLRLNSESFELPAWLQAMQGKVLDPHRAAKAQLPLQVWGAGAGVCYSCCRSRLFGQSVPGSVCGGGDDAVQLPIAD